MAQLIRDAGGAYFWDDEDARSLITYNFERVFDRAEAVDIWIGHTGLGPSVRALVSEDARLAQFRPVANERVYALSRRGGPLDRVLYRDQSLDHPAQLLADLIAVLHPDRMLNHQFMFIRRLP